MVIVEKKPSSDKPLIHWLIAAIDWLTITY
jgi:hypothetical protein